MRQQLTNSLASAENLSGSCGTGLSEPIANMAAIGFISALKYEISSVMGYFSYIGLD